MKEALVWSPVSGQACLTTPVRGNSSEGGVGHAGWGGNEVGEGEKREGKEEKGWTGLCTQHIQEAVKKSPLTGRWPPYVGVARGRVKQMSGEGGQAWDKAALKGK